MLTRSDFSSKYPGIEEGVVARSSDGEKIGKVSAMNDDSFTVQKGFFFPEDFMFRYEDVQDFRDGELILSTHQKDLADWREPSYSGWSQVRDINTGGLNATPRAEYQDRYSHWGKDNVSVPVMEEELQAQKTLRQAGEVKLRKIVHTELKHFTIPVMREEVRVERVPASESTATTGTLQDAGAFKEKTVSVPVMEEEVTITKRPVLKEEVRLTKERIEESQDVSGEVRKEKVEVEGEDAIRRHKDIDKKTA